MGVTSCKKPTSGGQGTELPNRSLDQPRGCCSPPPPTPHPSSLPSNPLNQFPHVGARSPEGHVDQVWGGSREGEPRDLWMPRPSAGPQRWPRGKQELLFTACSSFFCFLVSSDTVLLSWRRPLARQVPGGLHMHRLELCQALGPDASLSSLSWHAFSQASSTETWPFPPPDGLRPVPPTLKASSRAAMFLG